MLCSIVEEVEFRIDIDGKEYKILVSIDDGVVERFVMFSVTDDSVNVDMLGKYINASNAMLFSAVADSVKQMLNNGNLVMDINTVKVICENEEMVRRKDENEDEQ